MSDGIYTDIVKHWQQLSDDWREKLSYAKRQELSRLLLAIAAKLCWDTHPHQVELFKLAEKDRIHFLPSHFYSPVPILTELDPAIFDKYYCLPGISLDRAAHLDWLLALSEFGPEMARYRAVPHLRSPDFFWNNPRFGKPDAILYYTMIRYLKPRQIIEVGGGYSTLLAADAVKKNGSGRIMCIDPNPIAELMAIAGDGTVEIMQNRVQEVRKQLFISFDQNDILFVDSTHISKIGSDVNYIFFEILPLLPTGCYVHFHDIFFPMELPRYWIEELNNFFNEQYLLMAFLMHNNSWKMEFSASFACHHLQAEFAHNFRSIYGSERPGGSSAWLKRVAV